MRRSAVYARKYRFKKRSPRPAARSARYVRGYRGGRPSYGTMARNAWPFRAAPVRRARYAARRGTIKRTGDGNFTVSRAYMKKKPSIANRIASKLTADHTLRAQGAKRIEAASGLQAMWSHTFQQGLDGFKAQDGTHISNEWTVIGGGTDGRMIYKKMTKLLMQLANNTNVCCNIDIYDLEVKEDAPATATEKEPVWYLRQAWDDNFSAGDNTDYIQVRQGIPTGKNIFTNHWKVVKKQTIKLNPGQVHDHAYVRYPHKRIEYGTNVGANTMETGAGGSMLQHIKGITYAVMVIVNGYPVNDRDNTALVNYSGVCVNATWHHTSVFHECNDNTRYYNYATNSLDPVGTLVNVNVMNDDAGAVQAYDTA